jgi:hypothetical protein
MNKNILKQLKFGFEIEGNFENSDDLLDLSGKFVDDGSVGSEEEIILPKGFNGMYIEGGDGGEDCASCDGRGYWNEECNCDSDIHNCRHEHTNRCGTLPNYSTCTHSECGDDCYIRPCDEQDDYHERSCDDCGGSGQTGSGEEVLAQEYNSKIIKDLKTLKQELSQFKSGQNHIWNRTCGLHLHVSPKVFDYQLLWNAVGDLDFLNRIFREALGWCECQKKRLLYQDNLYYQSWKNPFDFIKTFQGKYQERNFNGDSLKYRFMRFHDHLKTLEFRFLCPCQHKEENIENLLSLLTDYLADQSAYIREGLASDNNPLIEQVINIPEIQTTLAREVLDLSFPAPKSLVLATDRRAI